VSSLAARAVRSGAVVSVGRVVQAIVGLAAVAILARLLDPSDFGVMALVLPFALLAGQALNQGLHVAVLHDDRVTAGQAALLFWRGQRFNIALLGAFAMGAPVVAWIVGEPRVTPVALLWVVALAFQGAAAFPDALLKRQMRFTLATAVQLTGIVSGAAAAVAAALAGLTTAALALQFVVWHGVCCVGMFAATRWNPCRPRLAGADVDQRSMNDLWRFSSHLTSARVFSWFGRQGDRLVVGYFSDAAALGLYDGARRWSFFPFQELFFSISDLAVTSLSKVRHDARVFREYGRRGFTAVLTLSLPAVAFIGVEADRVVRTLLGDAWLEAVPLVRILSVAACIDSVTRLTQWIYTAEGRTTDQRTWSFVSGVVTIAAVLLVARDGILPVTWAFAITTGVLAVPAVAFCLRGSVFTWQDYAHAAGRPALAAAFAAVAWNYLKSHLPLPGATPVEVAVAIPLFTAVYVLVWVGLPGGPAAARELAQAVRALR
jgi:O-antigen/teichoic acid export membrane protein